MIVSHNIVLCLDVPPIPGSDAVSYYNVEDAKIYDEGVE